MKGLMAIGLVLLALGGVLMVVGFIPYKDTDPVVDIGPVEITKTKEKKARIPLAVSGTVLGLGAALTLAGALKKN